MKTSSTCKNCNKNYDHDRSSKGIYCSKKCQFLWQHENKWLPAWKEGKTTRREIIRKRLTEDRGYKCEICGLSEWEEKSITLQVDHIDGVSDNNMPDNLRLLCPNCHSQTPTYKGGNKKNLKMDKRNIDLRRRYATVKMLDGGIV